MTKGQATRDAIVSEALHQAVVLGLDGLSVGGIAQTMPLSKSGVFAHFKSREALQLEVLNRAAAQFKTAVVRPAFACAAGPERLRTLFSAYLGWMLNGAGSGGCLFVGAAQEFDDRPGPVRERLVEILTDWRAAVRDVVQSSVSAEALATADVEQAVFEFLALALGFQQSARLMVDQHAETRAMAGLERLIATLGARSWPRPSPEPQLPERTP